MGWANLSCYLSLILFIIYMHYGDVLGILISSIIDDLCRSIMSEGVLWVEVILYSVMQN